jgi:MoaA/NifB/PqqE/SkfB family radical SAM enzyme
MEWKDKFNSFNSWKGLLYQDWYKAIIEWKNGERQVPLPPVEASLDPIQACQLKCSHCNASRYLEHPPKDKMIRMPDEALMELVKFLGTWGVKAVCFGGGGSPTLHTKLGDALLLAKSRGLESSIATNGINFDDKLIDIAVRTCRWIGVSVDSATPETYLKGRKRDLFNKTIANIKKLSQRAKELKVQCDIAYKFLVFEYNQHEIYDACKLAKQLGVKDFHVRPADLSHQGMDEKYKGKAKKYNVDYIKKEFERCHELEDNNFRVITAIHKFDSHFNPIKTFSQCYASPCCIQLCPSGEIFLCPDQRYNDKYKLGQWYPDPEHILDIWGSKKHYDLVFNSGRKMCSTRCTFNPYNIQIERLFINKNDPFCRWFI